MRTIIRAVARKVYSQDVGLFYVFNTRLRHPLVSVVMRTVTHLGSAVFAVVLPLLLVLVGRGSARKTGYEMAVMLTVSQAIIHTMKRLVRRRRPYKVLQNAAPAIVSQCQYSFPSGHTGAAFAMALVLSQATPAWGSIYLSLAILVGISRVYLGVHYPSDVVCGFLIAYIAFAARVAAW